MKFKVTPLRFGGLRILLRILIMCLASAAYSERLCAAPQQPPPPETTQGTALAEDRKAPPAGDEKEQNREKPQRPNLGNWWERNAASYDPVPTRLLFHTEGTLSYQQLSGNNSGNILNGNARLIVRKEYLSIYLTYKHLLQDVNYGGGTGNVDLVRRNLVGILRYDLNKRVYLAGGAIKARDDSFKIGDRQIFYGGLGVIYSPKPAHIFGALGAIGHHKSVYDFGLVTLKQTGIAPYVEGSWIWAVTERIRFNVSADYLRYQENSSTYRGIGRSADFNLSLNLQLIKHIALSLGNNFRYEDNQIVKLTGLKTTDNAVLIGVNFSY